MLSQLPQLARDYRPSFPPTPLVISNKAARRDHFYRTTLIDLYWFGHDSRAYLLNLGQTHIQKTINGTPRIVKHPNYRYPVLYCDVNSGVMVDKLRGDWFNTTEDFTIEVDVCPLSIPNDSAFMAADLAYNVLPATLMGHSGRICLGFYIDGSTVLTMGQWYKVILMRTKGIVSLFVNNVSQFNPFAHACHAMCTRYWFGWAGQQRFEGYIGRIRITKAARFTITGTVHATSEPYRFPALSPPGVS